MRQVHHAGDKMFVDFAGRTVEVIDPLTGEVRTAQVFVAALGASSYTYAEAVWSQSLPGWISAHVRAFGFMSGSVRLVVPDNLKSGVIKACFFEPEIQRTYNEMLDHYQAAAVPARPYKPRDKAKAEVGVQVVQRWILARLRNQTFFSLEELNAAIWALLADLNKRVILAAKPHPEQGFRAAIGILNLVKRYDRDRVEAACHRGIDIGAHSYSAISSILKHDLDRAYLTPKSTIINHENIRGSRYFH